MSMGEESSEGMMSERESRKPRGRPARHPQEIEAAKLSILHSALRVFGRDGEDPPVKAILEEAGISRATFYKYFDSKRSLQEALLNFATSRIIPIKNHI